MALTLGKWTWDQGDDKVWVRKDKSGEGQIRAKITFYEKVGAITDFFFPNDQQPPALSIPHGSSISVQMAHADKSMKEAGHELEGDWNDLETPERCSENWQRPSDNRWVQCQLNAGHKHGHTNTE